MSFLTEDFGKKPELPPWMAIDPTQNQQATITGNQSVLPSAEQLASSVNTFNLGELERLYGLSSATLKKIGENIGAQARGEIPQDVQDLLHTNAATKAAFGGYGGTGMARNLVARDFGLTSLGLKQQGLDSASRWMAASKANSFNVESMFLTPTQRYGQASNERDLKFKHDYLQAQIEAMPNPAVRGIMDALRSTGIAYLGGSYQQGTDYTSPTGGNGDGWSSGGGSGGDVYGSSSGNYWEQNAGDSGPSAANNWGAGSSGY